MVRSATWISGASVNALCGVTRPSESIPATVTSLKVDPGSYVSVTARFRWRSSEASGILVRVESGRARHGEDRAGARIHHDRGRGLRVPLLHGLPELELRVRLDRVVDRQVDVASVALGHRLEHVEGAAERVLDHRLLPALAGEQPVERELDAREPAVVDPRVAEQRRSDPSLRIDAPLFA